MSKGKGSGKRIGGLKRCEKCGKEFDAFRSWDKYCSNACGSKVRVERFWKNKLKGADLKGPKEDFWKVLDTAPNEVSGLRQAMLDGKIDGSQYTGECACLVGTIANVRKCDVNALEKNSERPSERWFMMFEPGHTPKNHAGMKVTLGWLDEWIEKNKDKVGAK